jgi:pilus assembly protein CpaE
MKALAFLRSDTTREDLTRRLRELPALSFEVVADRSLPAIDADIVFVEIDVANADDLAFIGSIKAAADTVAITNAASPQDVLRAVRAGAEDVLVRPIDTREIRDVVNRLAERRKKNRPETVPRAQLLTFAHAAGGAGATTLAVNAAIALTHRCESGDVCLIDFDIQYGAAASQLDLPSASPIRDLIEDPDRLDREMLEGMMVRHSSGLRVLTAPRLPLPFEALNSAIVTRILETAQRHHRFVIVDMPHALTPWFDTVMRRSNVIYLVTQLGVPAAHQMKKFCDVLVEEHLSDLPIRVIVNRQQGVLSKGADVSATQIEHVIGRPVDHFIPNDYSLVMTSLNQGKPVLAQNRSARFSQSIIEMIRDVTGDLFEAKRRANGLSVLSQKFFGG